MLGHTPRDLRKKAAGQPVRRHEAHSRDNLLGLQPLSRQPPTMLSVLVRQRELWRGFWSVQ